MLMQKKFATGMIVKNPKAQAPKWIMGHLSVKVDEFVKFLSENQKNGWVNLDVCIGKTGKMYAQLDEWQPDASRGQTRPGYAAPAAPAARTVQVQSANPSDDVEIDDIPFDPPAAPAAKQPEPSGFDVYSNRSRGSNYCGD